MGSVTQRPAGTGVDGAIQGVSQAIQKLENGFLAGNSAVGSAGTFSPQGNINVQATQAGVSPGTTGNDNVLAVYTLPANAFDQALRNVTITACGSQVNNANTKRIKIIIGATTAVVGSAVTGGTTIADSGATTTIGGGWCLCASVFKVGAANSNTQLTIHQSAQIGATVQSLAAPSNLTLTENAAVIIAVTGNATTATTDIVFNMLEVNWNN